MAGHIKTSQGRISSREYRVMTCCEETYGVGLTFRKIAYFKLENRYTVKSFLKTSLKTHSFKQEKNLPRPLEALMLSFWVTQSELR